MNYKVLYPIDRRYRANEKIIFLAGPIRGSSEWQFEAIKFLKQRRVDAHITSPRRPHIPTEVEARRLDIPWRFYSSEEQSDWEVDTIMHAYTCGVVMFWFQKEQEHNCDHCHAQTTRVEAGIIIGHAMTTPTNNLVVGIEDEFDGAPYLRHTFRKRAGVTRIHRTLQATLEATIDRIKTPT